MDKVQEVFPGSARCPPAPRTKAQATSVVEFRSLELVKQDIRNVNHQSQLQWQYNHKIIHHFLSNSCILLLPGFQLLPPWIWILHSSQISGSFGASYYNITIQTGVVKTPGEINIAELSHFSVKHFPGAPGASQLFKKYCPQKMANLREFRSFNLTVFPGARWARDELIHRLSPATLSRWSLEFVSSSLVV